jgi:hypothetical protein
MRGRGGFPRSWWKTRTASCAMSGWQGSASRRRRRTCAPGCPLSARAGGGRRGWRRSPRPRRRGRHPRRLGNRRRRRSLPGLRSGCGGADRGRAARRDPRCQPGPGPRGHRRDRPGHDPVPGRRPPGLLGRPRPPSPASPAPACAATAPRPPPAPPARTPFPAKGFAACPGAPAGTGPSAPSPAPSSSSSGTCSPTPPPGSPTSAPTGTNARPAATIRSAPTSASSRPSASTSPSPPPPPKPNPADQARCPKSHGPPNHVRIWWLILTVTVGFAFGSNPPPATTCENGPLAASTRLCGPFYLVTRRIGASS